MFDNTFDGNISGTPLSPKYWGTSLRNNHQKYRRTQIYRKQLSHSIDCNIIPDMRYLSEELEDIILVKNLER